LGYIACMGEMKMHTEFLFENLRVRSHSEEVHTDARIILKLILNI